PVFALTNLPEVVKAALFARYSRSSKSLRRLLIDEFLDGERELPRQAGAGEVRASELFDRVFFEYGDDSVAQLAGAHLAVEGISNVMTKVLQWGRLASYLEQSTRYISFAERRAGRYRYHVPTELAGAPQQEYRLVLDRAFDRYGELAERLRAYVESQVPQTPGTPAAARRRAVNARALDAVRGLLPAATTANVGVFASGQAYEAMLLRMRAHPLAEARECAEAMLHELRRVIPSFLTRVDREDRGGVHSAYLSDIDAAAAELAQEISPSARLDEESPTVRLVDFDPDAERRVLAHALLPHTNQSLARVIAAVDRLGAAERHDALMRLAGDRSNRRHKPGRALEAATYTFEIVCDYGAYRDLQRHRMLSLQVQPLSVDLGYEMPVDVADAECAGDYAEAQEESAALFRTLLDARPTVAPYAVTLAHRIRFTLVVNAREAMHLIELRSQPQGHEAYRRVAQLMHDQIANVAGHRALADMMRFVDHSTPAAGRLAAEARSEGRSSSTP
ncbi:MAG: FAD-dependent thymidylate synthase, partial [Thermoleophilia bacterium]|nr:FAD-dependent thymidylate synthase [Thermoleophilia bacterium]